MKRMSQVPILFLALAITCGAAWALQNGSKLTLDGKVISTDVQNIRGRAYVPVSDVATALDRTVARKGGTYQLVREEGTNPIHGTAGKISTDVFSGKWRLHVASVQQVADYRPQYGSQKDQILPKETTDVLVMIKCQLKNGTNEMQEVYFDKDSSGNTALRDDQGHGYVPVAYDSRNSGYSSDKMPAGTTHDFIVIFSIPKGVNVKDLVYTVGGSGLDKIADFRVALIR